MVSWCATKGPRWRGWAVQRMHCNDVVELLPPKGIQTHGIVSNPNPVDPIRLAINQQGTVSGGDSRLYNCKMETKDVILTKPRRILDRNLFPVAEV